MGKLEKRVEISEKARWQQKETALRRSVAGPPSRKRE